MLHPVIISYIVISLIVIGVLSFFLMKKPESFCLCQGMNRQVCPNPALLKQLYNDGVLTEYTDFSKLEKQWKNGDLSRY